MRKATGNMILNKTSIRDLLCSIDPSTADILTNIDYTDSSTLWQIKLEEVERAINQLVSLEIAQSIIEILKVFYGGEKSQLEELHTDLFEVAWKRDVYLEDYECNWATIVDKFTLLKEIMTLIKDTPYINYMVSHLENELYRQ